MRPARHALAASARWPLLVLLSLLAACSEPPAAAPVPQQHALELASVGSGVPLEHTAIGSVVSDERVDVASRLSGFIREMPVREGDRVRRGDVLARIDGSDIESGVRQAQAALASAEASQRDATVDAARFQQLFDKGSVSDSELRKARLRQEAAEEAANQARAALDSALAQRDYTQIRSPIDGVVVARLRQAGDLATPGMPLLSLESASRLVFETTLTESQLAGVHSGQAVTLHIDGMAQPLSGRVSRVVASADPVTRSFPVQIALPATRGLLPGMFGRAVFVLGASTTPAVPRDALTERGGLRGVFVVDSAGRAGFRWLRTGREWPQRVEVLAGLDAGERIVLQPPPTLREGDLVSDAAATRSATPAP
jgi:multidrug efflux system membrane fusion protein